jgi:hypothetical protein
LEVTNVALEVAIEMLDADRAVTLTFEKEMDIAGGTPLRWRGELLQES